MMLPIKINLLRSTLLLSAGITLSTTVSAVPCGLEEVLTYVGKDAFKIKNIVNGKGIAQQVYDTLFFPSEYPYRPGTNRPIGNPTISEMVDFSLRRFQGPTSQYIKVPGYVTASDYYQWSNLETAADAGRSDGIRKFACTGTLTERISELAGFFANIGQETSGASPTETNYTAGVAWNMSKYAEDNSWGQCPASTSTATTLYSPAIDATGEPVFDVRGNTKLNMWMCGYTDPTAPVDFTKNLPVYTLSNDATKEQVGTRAPGYSIYYGRGPKQLTYYYNYTWAGPIIDKQNPGALLDNPNLLLINPTMGWESALAYQMVRYKEPGVSYTKPSMHDVYSSSNWLIYNQDHPQPSNRGKWGFGQTINVLNGGVECKTSTNYRTLSRMNNYIELMIRMGVDVKNVKIGSQVLEREALDANIYDRTERYSWGDKQRRWITAPMPMTLYASPLPGPYVITYMDPAKNTLINERIDCQGYLEYAKDK
jgi:hypothetical protein